MRLLEIAPRAGGRFRLSFDDGSRLTATENELVRFGLHAGMDLSDAEAENLRAACAESAARERAARLAAARPLSKTELKRKLIRKGQSASAAGAAADWLESLGALDDRAYASEVVRHYAGRFYGPMKLRDELRKRGIDRSLWGEALAQAPEPSETLRAYFDARLRGRAPSPEERRRLADTLRRRGFAWEDIAGILGEWEESF
ncbi:MAG TPA: regulatory protein RecX [Oscillospiraceae bacterium]|nr:regulatory protein RecX [Oscillospiraceae bacterium]